MEKKSKCSFFRDEFNWGNCGFHHSAPEEFVKSQWQTKTRSIIYLIYRIIVAGFFIGVVADSMAPNYTIELWGRWFIYFTHWGILFCMITGVFGLVLVAIWHFKPNYSEKLTLSQEMPVVFKIYWCFHSVTFVCAIVITVIYWSLLYNPDEDELSTTNVLTHMTNAIVMFVDILIVSYPIRFLHFIQPLLVGAVYSVFSVVYYFCDGTDSEGNPYIYDVLDWRNVGKSSGTLIGTLFLACFVHIVLFFIYRLRVTIHERCCSRDNKSSKGSATQIGISMVLGNHGNDNPGYINTEKVV